MTLDELKNKITVNTRVHVVDHRNADYSGWYAVTMIRPEYVALSMRDGGHPLWLTWPVSNHYWISGTALHVPEKDGLTVASVFNFSI